jgi:site-specific recombinase XerD
MEVQQAISEFILDCEARGLAESTVRWYRQRLRGFGRSLEEAGLSDVTRVTTAHLRSFLTRLHNQKRRWVNHPCHPPSESGLSVYTIHGYVRILRVFFKWLFEENITETNPAMRVRLPKLPKEPPKAVSTEDRNRLLEAAKPDPRDYAIVCFLVDTGCRVGGLASLTIQNLDLERGEALVTEKGKGGGKARLVYFNGCARAALARWLKARPESKTDRVFVQKFNKDKALQAGGVYQVLERLAKKSGVKGRFNPHSFRHAWAREALRNGANLADVAQVLGHEDEGVTLRFYGRWAQQELKERHSQFSPLADD